MSRSSKSRMYYSEDLKLSVLKDKYENNLSLGCAAKKYGIKTHTCICAWEKKYSVDSKLLSLSDEVITRVNMQKRKVSVIKQETALTREEQLALEVENLRKALAYSELRNEALHEVLKIGKEQYDIDLLKKAGAKQ